MDVRTCTGPDSSTTLIKHVKAKRRFHFEMRFHASVLHMRGTDVTPQPFTAPNGDVLLFNGEIFDGLEVSWCCRTELRQELITPLDRTQRERRSKAIRPHPPRGSLELLRRNQEHRRSLRLRLLPSLKPADLLCARSPRPSLPPHASPDAHLAIPLPQLEWPRHRLPAERVGGSLVRCSALLSSA